MATIAAPGESVLTAPASADRAAPATQRIEALDFVRGVALCGILLMNITGFGLPDAYLNPTNAGGATGPDLWAWIITQMGFEGTQRALFSMLFGASVILLTSRLDASGRTDAADIYFRRNLWLIAFGFVNAFVLLWYGDILYAYGVIALFVFAFRNMAAKWLLAIGTAALLLSAAWNVYESDQLLGKHEAYAAAKAAESSGATLTDAQTSAIAAWEQARGETKASPEGIQQSVRNHTSGYTHAFMQFRSLNVYFQTWFLYRFFFDIFGMMLIGMGLYRLGVLTLQQPAGIYLAMLVAGYGVGLTINYLETRWILEHRFSALSFAQSNISYDLGRLAMTIGHLGLLLLIVRWDIMPWLRRAFAAVGQMAVTNYLMHSVICGILFIGFRQFNQLARHELYYVVLAVWIFQLVMSPIWLRYFRFGPVEWLWRYLTYLKRPPFVREPALTAPAAALAA